MSDSSIALKPVIEEPSKPIPPSKASSSSAALMEKLLSWPRMSVNHSRTKRMPRSSTIDLTSSGVRGDSALSAIGLLHGRVAAFRKARRLTDDQARGGAVREELSVAFRADAAVGRGHLPPAVDQPALGDDPPG